VVSLVKHSKEDALERDEFEELVEACDKSLFPKQNRFLVLVMGRLGLRAAEVAHMKESWLVKPKKMIRIPKHEPCDCSSCRAQAKQRAEVNDDISFKEAMEMQWRVKTENSARSVPYDLEDRIEEIVLDTMDEYGECPVGRYRINKRIDKLSKIAFGDKSRVYPHALRATAAFNYCFQEVTAFQLMTLMGWNQLQTANDYLMASGVTARKAVDEIRE